MVNPDSMPLTGAVVVFMGGQPVVPVGGHISYQILNNDPPGFILTGLLGTGVVIDTQVEDTISGMLVSFAPPVLIGWNPDADGFNSVTVRIFLPDCYSDFNYPGDMGPIFD